MSAGEGFDIQSLLKFRPYRYQCMKCLALLRDLPGLDKPLFKPHETMICPTCGVTYLIPENERYGKWLGYSFGIARLEGKDDLAHCRELGVVADNFRRRSETVTEFAPLNYLFQAISLANSFIHYTSWGMSQLLMGALKLASFRAPYMWVRGIVGNLDESTMSEFNRPNEALFFEGRVFPKGASWSEVPHQKILVVDGLLAFKGSGNLTLNSWRKAGRDLDMIEVVTDIEEVSDLHNRYFARTWGSLSDIGPVIDLAHPPSELQSR